MAVPTAPRSSLGLAELIRARLAGEADLGLAGVHEMLDLGGARKSLRVPCAAAMVLADSFDPPLSADDDEIVTQRHHSTVAVAVGVSASNDPGGRKGGTGGRLTELIQATRAVLLGWPPEGESIARRVTHMDAVYRSLKGPSASDTASHGARWRPLILQRGRLVAIDDGSGRAWWQDEYATSRLVRGAVPDVVNGASVPGELYSSLNDGADERVREAG